MVRSLTLLAGALLLLTIAMPLLGDYPQPSPYPISWELTATFGQPKRIVVQAPGDDQPVAYWYITYHVVNNTDKDKIAFYPDFQMQTNDGLIIPSDHGIAPAVFDAIKDKERIKFLQDYLAIGGDLRQGEDQSKDGVAIWREPAPRMGTFAFFISGFWGESATVHVADQDVILRKTLNVTYHTDNDDAHPGQGTLQQLDSQYIMR